MAGTTPFDLTIISTDRVFYTGKALQIVFEASDGRRAIMANHVRSYMSVREGDVEFQKEDGSWIVAVASRGYVQVAHHQVEMVVDTIELPEDIDVLRAQEAMERAQQQLQSKQSIVEYKISKANLSRAMARLSASSKFKKV